MNVPLYRAGTRPDEAVQGTLRRADTAAFSRTITSEAPAKEHRPNRPAIFYAPTPNDYLLGLRSTHESARLRMRVRVIIPHHEKDGPVCQAFSERY